jgi:protease I
MSAAGEVLRLTGKRVGILVEFNFEDVELLYPLYRFREDGATTFTIGNKAGETYKGKYGYPNKCDKSISDVSADDLDALIIPGGFAPDYWRRSPAYCKLVKDSVDKGIPVAAICHGPWMLVSAKVLQGKKATCFMSIKDDISNAGATYVEGQPVVVDGNIITSRTPDDIGYFCKEVTKQLLAQQPQKL